MKSAADVIIRIAKEIAGDGEINGLCKRYSGRAVKVMVGGYGKDEDGLTEANAPFIWVYPQSDDMPLGATDQISELKVGIVVGLCVEKDAPSLDGVRLALNGLTYRAASLASTVERFADAVGTDDYRAAAADAQEAKDAVDAAAAEFVKVIEAADMDGSAVAFMNTNHAAAALDSAARSALTAAEATGAHDYVVEAIRSDVETMSAAQVAFGAAWASAVAAYEKFQEDPYFRETISERDTDHGGVVIFGALRVFDAFRRRLHDLMIDGDFGLMATDVTFRNNSISHYPLDWLEFTVTFGEPAHL